MITVIYIENSNIIELPGLKDEATDTFINSATVEVELTDEAGVAIDGETWPLALNYVSSSDGIYRAVVPPLTVQQFQSIRYSITATSLSGAVANWQGVVLARYRRGSE